MKKILISLALGFILVSNVCFAKSVKFVQITDVNYGKGDAEKYLDKAIFDVNSMKDVDFVVFTGDNVCSAKEELLKRFTKHAKTLNKPFYMVTGDRDVSKGKGMPKDIYAKKLHKLLGRKSPKTLNYSFIKNNIAFVVVDGSKDFITMQNGYFSPKTLDWISQQLNKYAEKKVVIIQHFPIANKTNNDMLYSANAINYLKLLNEHNNVISVIAGHFNKNDEISLNGIYHVVTPSVNQNCYKIIEIDEENGYQIFTTLIKMD